MRCPMDMDALLCFAPLPLNAAVRCPAVLCMSISNEIIRLPLEAISKISLWGGMGACRAQSMRYVHYPGLYATDISDRVKVWRTC